MSRRRVLNVHQEGSEEQARAALAQPVAKSVACAHLDQIRNARDGLVQLAGHVTCRRVQGGRPATHRVRRAPDRFVAEHERESPDACPSDRVSHGERAIRFESHRSARGRR